MPKNGRAIFIIDPEKPQKGDYRNVSLPEIAVGAGETIANIEVNCTNDVKPVSIKPVN